MYNVQCTCTGLCPEKVVYVHVHTCTCSLAYILMYVAELDVHHIVVAVRVKQWSETMKWWSAPTTTDHR